jgi:hypothetical protein
MERGDVEGKIAGSERRGKRVEEEKARTRARSKKTIPIMPITFSVLLYKFTMKHLQNHYALLVSIQ